MPDADPVTAYVPMIASLPPGSGLVWRPKYHPGEFSVPGAPD
jgi:hypothetical protein